MKKMHVISFCIACLFIVNQASAHALWIATKPTGKSGKAQQVHIYYGEPAEGVLENVTDWWSDVGSFVLTLHHPDGSSQQLETSAQADHHVATFTPTKEGVYTLSVAQPVKETFDGHKYQFNSTAFVNVGNAGEPTLPETSDFRVISGLFDTKAGKPISLKAQLGAKPLNKLEVTVFSPNGWSKTFHTDESGLISFVPDRKGHYLVEALYSVDVDGADHKHLHRIATWSIKID